jgi:ankyrin repeat protein
MKILPELLAAIDSKDLKKAKRLLKAHPYLFHAECPQGWPVIHRCIVDPVNHSCLDLEMVKHYIAHGGDVNQKAGGGVSLLFLAARHFQGEAINDCLVAHGASMSTFEQSVVALFRGENKSEAKREVVRLVNKEPHLVHQTDYEGWTLLHHAIRHYHFRLVPFLLEKGANINSRTHTGKTALFFCGIEPTDREGVACRKWLAERGARLSAKEEIVELIYFGKDDEAIKRFERQPELRNSWVDYGGSKSFLHVAAWLGKTEGIVEYLLRSGIDPNTQDDDGRTPLFWVARRIAERMDGSAQIIRALVRRGADQNHRDDEGHTPLHAMAGHGWDGVLLKLLMELGADLNIESNDGRTPLDVVYQMGFLGGRSLAHWMKSKGARRSLKGR